MLLVRSARPLDLADPFGADLLDLTAESQRVSLTVEALDGRGIVLGRHVGAARVAGSRASGLARRVSSGAPLFLDRGVYAAFAVPSIDHQFKDATPRNLLNRHVRPMLGALRACGLQATYLGRDWISVLAGGERRAMFAIGYEGLPSGEILFEFFASLQSDLRIPPAIASDLELATNRFGGRPTFAADNLADPGNFVERLRARLAEALASSSDPEEVLISPSSRLLRDPGPCRGAPVEVPIGWLDAFADGRVGGDLMCASWVLDHAQHSRVAPEAALLDGATWADVMCVKLRG